MGRISIVIEVCRRMFIVLYDYLYQDTVNNLYCFKPHNTKGINLISFLISNQCILLICFYDIYLHFLHVCVGTYVRICTCMQRAVQDWSQESSLISFHLIYWVRRAGSFTQTRSSRNPSLPPCPPGISMGSGFQALVLILAWHGFDTLITFSGYSFSLIEIPPQLRLR